MRRPALNVGDGTLLRPRDQGIIITGRPFRGDFRPPAADQQIDFDQMHIPGQQPVPLQLILRVTATRFIGRRKDLDDSDDRLGRAVQHPNPMIPDFLKGRVRSVT